MKESIKLISEQFNAQNILWGIGGSLMLKEYGIVDKANDIDILICPRDVKVDLDIMNKIGTMKTPPYKSEYNTKGFYNFEVLGVDVDIMVRLMIKHSDGIYEFKFDENSITKRVDFEGVSIPYSSLEEWYVAYNLMIGRENKVELIEHYFTEYGIEHKELLFKALQQNLPIELKKKLKRNTES